MERLKIEWSHGALKSYLWELERCTAERPAPSGERIGWIHASVYMEPHPTDPRLARFICPHCGRDEWTYPTFQPRGKRWRPGEDEFY